MATIDNEMTQFPAGNASNRQGAPVPPPLNPAPQGAPRKKNNSNWKNAAIGAGAGVAIGGAAAMAMGMAPNEDAAEEVQVPEWSDGEVKVATGITDDMSFDEAFAAARNEVGPGGAFEWRGHVYGTYTKSEWNNMTAEERAEYNEHFSWGHGSSESYAHNSTHHTDVHHHDTAHEVHIHHDEPVVTHEEVSQVEVISAEPEVEVLGVVHDADTGSNYGAASIDGQEVILVDVDGDLSFDYLAADFNENGVIEDDEVIDISEHNLTVNDLGGFTDGYDAGGDMLADDGPDYTNDDVFYEG